MTSPQEPRAYLRTPSLRGDTLAFVCDDDLWLASTAGGIARRVTAGLSEPSTPSLSPDGRWIAYVGRDEQHAEVYVMPAEGGPAKRLTWLGPDTMVRGWTRDGRILFVTTYGQPFFRNYRAYTVAPSGGEPQLLPYGQVNHLSFGPGERKVIGRNTADPARWKRYRGGTAGHLWVDAEGSGQFRRMKELKGNVTSPLWIGDRIYHLSDFEGVANLYSTRPDGSDLRRHTEHQDFYARHAASDGQRIVYQCGAEVWLFDPASNGGKGSTKRIEIETPSHRTQAARKFVPAADHLGGLHVHPQGHSVALDTRGQLVTMGLWEGAVRRHGQPAGDDSALARLRHGQWLGDGERVVAVSDASGEEQVVVFEGSATAPSSRSFDSWDVGRVTELRAAPVGSRIALANHRNELWVGDVDSGVLTQADTSEYGRFEGLAWSPDGQWLAYSAPTSIRHAAIKLHRLGSGTSTLVTQPEFRDLSPSFDPAGKYLYFVSLRTFDPVYDSVQFELSFPRAARPYLIALQAGGTPPFEPAPKGLKEGGPGANGAKDAKTDAKADDATPPALQVDLDGIVRRIAPFPVAEDRFARVVGAAGGKVVWSIQPIVGAHGRGGHADGPSKLQVFDFASGRAEPLAEKADAFELAADGVTLVLRDAKKLRAISVNRSPDADKDPAAASGAPSRKSGWLDLDRVRLSVAPRAEWRQMLREVWRLQRDQFWTADMSGIDWNEVYARYAPLVERVATRAELSDLIWEMQGELGTSHAYEMGGDHRRPPQVALGYLGAEWRWNEAARGYEITRIVDGDTWDPAADSPLNAIGVEARAGECIVAVDGQRVSRERPPQSLLVHQAATKVELTLTDGSGANARNVLVKTLADEVPARYREWVERNRAWVHERSGGKVGYLHLPDMMAAGFAEFHRYFIAECDRDGLIVDVRYNRGGHVSQLLLEKVARKRIGYDFTRWNKPTPYPAESVNGPVVALTNEHAGSDGDIFSHSFKLMGLGTLVGTRTWGGVIGIWPRHGLVDGSSTTQPEFAFWFKDVGWNVENYGTDPQVEVDNAPQDHVAGRDQQLETALATALKQIDERSREPAWNFEPRPQLARPAWPTRG